MNVPYRASALVALALLISACDAEETGGEETPSPVVGTWEMTSHQTKVGDEEFSSPSNAACIEDSIEEFAADGRWTLYPGEVLCESETLPATLLGHWRLEASDTKLVFTFDDFVGDYFATVVTLTDTELVYDLPFLDIDGTIARKTYVKR